VKNVSLKGVTKRYVALLLF